MKHSAGGLWAIYRYCKIRTSPCKQLIATKNAKRRVPWVGAVACVGEGLKHQGRKESHAILGRSNPGNQILWIKFSESNSQNQISLLGASNTHECSYNFKLLDHTQGAILLCSTRYLIQFTRPIGPVVVLWECIVTHGAAPCANTRKTSGRRPWAWPRAR